MNSTPMLKGYTNVQCVCNRKVCVYQGRQQRGGRRVADRDVSNIITLHTKAFFARSSECICIDQLCKIDIYK